MGISLRNRPVPSWGLPLRRGRSLRLVALLACRNEMRFLPGFVANVPPPVAGVGALDDGSDDGSADFLSGLPEVVELIRRPLDRPRWDEAGNYRALVEAGLRPGGGRAVSVGPAEGLEVAV